IERRDLVRDDTSKARGSLGYGRDLYAHGRNAVQPPEARSGPMRHHRVRYGKTGRHERTAINDRSARHPIDARVRADQDAGSHQPADFLPGVPGLDQLSSSDEPVLGLAQPRQRPLHGRTSHHRPVTGTGEETIASAVTDAIVPSPRFSGEAGDEAALAEDAQHAQEERER